MPWQNAIELYNSRHLNIKFDTKRQIFVQKWNHHSSVPMNEFRAELLEFKNLILDHKPKYILWLQEAFTTQLSTEDQMWIEQNINKECVEKGVEKCAFVMGKDVLAQMQVFNFFEEIQSCLTTKHFADEDEALNWLLDGELPNELNANDFEIRFNGKSEEGKSLFTIEAASINTESVLKTFNHLLKKNKFLRENSKNFYTLTKREKEVFQMYANGAGVKRISEELFLSELTVRTHWRNVKKKLNIKSHTDISDYKNSFYL